MPFCKWRKNRSLILIFPLFIMVKMRYNRLWNRTQLRFCLIYDSRTDATNIRNEVIRRD